MRKSKKPIIALLVLAAGLIVGREAMAPDIDIEKTVDPSSSDSQVIQEQHETVVDSAPTELEITENTGEEEGIRKDKEQSDASGDGNKEQPEDFLPVEVEDKDNGLNVSEEPDLNQSEEQAIASNENEGVAAPIETDQSFNPHNIDWDRFVAVSPNGESMPINDDPDGTVWVPIYGGKKYHRTAHCSSMDNPLFLTAEHAEALGFTPCAKIGCFH